MSTRSARRRPLAAHGQQRTPGPLAQILKLVGVVAAVLLVSGAGVAGYIALTFTGTVSANSVELENQKAVPPDIGAYEEGFDLLLVGLDQCEEKYKHLFGARCEGTDGDAPLNDVNLLVHVSEEPRRVTAVSMPRDLMVDSPECTDADGNVSGARGIQPLNTAWEHGGLSCVAKTVEALSGQDIEFAAAVTFGGVIEITNAIGGVEVCLATGIRDSETSLNLSAGTHTIEGYQALQFLRTRYGVGDGSDTGRIGNQQQYLSSLARKLVSSEVLGDVPTMLKLANTALSNLQTSTSLSENPMTIAQIALALKDIVFSDIVFVQYPNGSSAAYPNKVVPKYDAAELLWDAINANQPLEITHENGAADGVVVQGEIDAGSGEEAPAETADPTPAPTETAVALPDSISGNTAAQQTCSNGNLR